MEAFHQAFAAQQLVFVQQDASRRFGVAGRQIGLSTLRRIFTAYPAVVRRAFSLECRGSLPAHEDPLLQLLAAKAPEGSWYASCVLQRAGGVPLPSFTSRGSWLLAEVYEEQGECCQGTAAQTLQCCLGLFWQEHGRPCFARAAGAHRCHSTQWHLACAAQGREGMDRATYCRASAAGALTEGRQASENPLQRG